VAGGAVAGGLINVNTASAIDLEELPGVGEVIAQAIVDHRTENGSFTSVDQLLDVSGIGDATLEDIRELVTV
jgi:competence protein ComEA